MKKSLAAGSVAVLSSAIFLSGVMTGPAFADANCGESIRQTHSGNLREWKITWTNCAHKSSRKKVDIAYAPDLPCRRISAGSSFTWTYAVSGSNPAYPRGVKNC